MNTNAVLLALLLSVVAPSAHADDSNANAMFTGTVGGQVQSSNLTGTNAGATATVKFQGVTHEDGGALVGGAIRGAGFAGVAQGASNTGGDFGINAYAGGTNVQDSKGGDGYYLGLSGGFDFSSQTLQAITQAGGGVEGGFYSYHNGTRVMLGAFGGGGITQISPSNTLAIDGTYYQNWGVYGAQLGAIARVDVKDKLFASLKYLHTIGSSMYSAESIYACDYLSECNHTGHSDDLAASVDYKPWNKLPVVVEAEAKYVNAATNDNGSFQAGQATLSVGGALPVF